jgi:hypothetical protein
MTLVSNRETFTGNDHQEARIPLLTDQNTSANPTRNKSTHANKSQTIAVRRIGVLKWLCL